MEEEGYVLIFPPGETPPHVGSDDELHSCHSTNPQTSRIVELTLSAEHLVSPQCSVDLFPPSIVAPALERIQEPSPGGRSTSGSVQVGAYTLQERTARINQFRAKKKRAKKRRLFYQDNPGTAKGRDVKYKVRKRIADERPRQRGRFMSKSVEADKIE